jgi:hypothetical protein
MFLFSFDIFGQHQEKVSFLIFIACSIVPQQPFMEMWESLKLAILRLF